MPLQDEKPIEFRRALDKLRSSGHWASIVDIAKSAKATAAPLQDAIDEMRRTAFGPRDRAAEVCLYEFLGSLAILLSVDRVLEIGSDVSLLSVRLLDPARHVRVAYINKNPDLGDALHQLIDRERLTVFRSVRDIDNPEQFRLT